MSSVNIAAIFSEFSFLSRHADRKEIFDANVKRFDTETLGIHSYLCSYRVLLVGKDGDVITRVRFDKGDPDIFDVIAQPFMPWTWQGHLDGNVGGALKRLKAKARDVVYVVEVQHHRLTVYKPPKGYDSVGIWFLSQVEKKRKEFAAQ